MQISLKIMDKTIFYCSVKFKLFKKNPIMVRLIGYELW